LHPASDAEGVDTCGARSLAAYLGDIDVVHANVSAWLGLTARQLHCCRRRRCAGDVDELDQVYSYCCRLHMHCNALATLYASLELFMEMNLDSFLHTILSS